MTFLIKSMMNLILHPAESMRARERKFDAVAERARRSRERVIDASDELRSTVDDVLGRMGKKTNGAAQ